MEKLEFRNIRADEIDLRVGTVTEKGYTLLLYKNARVDMAMLDETGCIWQRDHKEIKGNLYCGIGIWNETINQFVWKWDCGVESFSEKEKGEASDSFKRAGFNWGIGRELYTAPFIWIGCKCDDKKIPYEEQKRIQKMRVDQIEITDGKITKLIIKENDNLVYKFQKEEPKVEKKPEPKAKDEPKEEPKKVITFQHTGEPILSEECEDGTAIAAIFDFMKTFYPDTLKDLHALEIELTKLPHAFGVKACKLSLEDIFKAIELKKESKRA